MLTFTSELLPARELMAKYAAWVVSHYVRKQDAAKYLQISRPTLDQLLKEAAQNVRPRPN